METSVTHGPKRPASFLTTACSQRFDATVAFTPKRTSDKLG
jgi:hypothetical protein